jgi:flagellar biosynthesis repressor protein FlbT
MIGSPRLAFINPHPRCIRFCGIVNVPLRVELKRGEGVILGACMGTNGDRRTRVTIEGAVPILRDKEIMTAQRANSSAKRIHLAIQRMYMGKRQHDDFATYPRLSREILAAMPDMQRLPSSQ